MAARNFQIDITKGIAIVLMIIGHCSLFGGTIRYLIFTFHMPLFFIFSGFFFRDKPIAEVAKTGFARLVKPYFVYALLTEVLYRLFWRKSVISCLLDILFAHGGPKHTMVFPTESSLGPIWFLMAIFWCRIFYAIIYKVSKNNIYMSAIVAFIISCLAIYVGKYLLNLPLGIITGAGGLAFYGIGPILKNISSKHLYLIVVVWLVAVLFQKTYIDMVNFNYLFYPFDFICGIGGSLFVFFVSGLLAKKANPQLMATLGIYSLEILCIHQVVFHVCNIFGCSSNSFSFFVLNISIPIILPLSYHKFKVCKS